MNPFGYKSLSKVSQWFSSAEVQDVVVQAKDILHQTGKLISLWNKSELLTVA